MKNLTGPNASSNTPLHRLSAVRHSLIEPSPAITEPARRLQARLLMAMLLVLLLLGLLSLTLAPFRIYAKSGESKAVTSMFVWITVIGVLLLAVGYGLSCTTYWPLAALLAVGTVLGATFLTVITSPQDLRSVSFLILGGLVASLFLSVRSTAIVFFVTFIGLLLLPALVSGFSTLSNLNALFFILTVGVLVVMAASLRQRYLEQIDSQTQQLVQSEARLREVSIRDPLTGLFNRRYLEESLELEMIRAVRSQYPIGIIMADIDHFKRFNDTYGHLAADAVLVQVARFLLTYIRSSDITCRYGGEEFILVLPGASREITQMRAGRMCERIRKFQLQFEDQSLEAVTLSLGVAVFPDHGSTYDVILGAADTALYRAKAQGRDRVVVAN